MGARSLVTTPIPEPALLLFEAAGTVPVLTAPPHAVNPLARG